MIPMVPCPAHGQYEDDDGQVHYLRKMSRVFCAVEYYPECAYCEHRDFSVLLVRADSIVTCPVLTHSLEGTLPDDPVRAADVQHVEQGGVITQDQIPVQTCLDQPFQTCSACGVCHVWISSPNR